MSWESNEKPPRPPSTGYVWNMKPSSDDTDTPTSPNFALLLSPPRNSLNWWRARAWDPTRSPTPALHWLYGT
jgi:hypothetical protein